MRDKARGIGRMFGDAGAFPECEVNTMITPDRTTIQVQRSGYGRAGICRSSWKGLNTGRHENAPVHYPCSGLAAHHFAPRTLFGSMLCKLTQMGLSRVYYMLRLVGVSLL